MPARLAVVLALAATASVAAPSGAGSPLPWRVWEDPRTLPRLDLPHRVLLRSSFCPSGCRYDRHTVDDPRVLRYDGDEAVIFEETGAGALTQIWVTYGIRSSAALDRRIRLRLYLDGEAKPRLELPLRDLFSGRVPPFVPPLVADRQAASGGFVSDVPIPYRAGCRVTLEGIRPGARLWYQLTFHRLPGADGVASFRGDEDLGRWREWLHAEGPDPWRDEPQGELRIGTVAVAGKGPVTLYERAGPGLLTGLRLQVEDRLREHLRLVLELDGETTVDLALADLFGPGRPAAPVSSVLLGERPGQLYLYFPIAFSRSAAIRLRSTADPAESAEVGFWIRRDARDPVPGSGLFGAELQAVEATTPGVDQPLLRLDGAGKWVGLLTRLGAVASRDRSYLEGDLRVYLDGAPDPAQHGTGVEDFFGGGFYFDHGPFQRALHGVTAQGDDGGEATTAAYRLLLTTAVPFETSIRAELESGPQGEMPMRRRSVALYYRSRATAGAAGGV